MAWNKNIVKNNENILIEIFLKTSIWVKLCLSSAKNDLSRLEKIWNSESHWRFKLHFSSPVHQTLEAAISKATFSGCTSWYKLRGLHPPLFWDFRNLNTRNQSKIKQPWALSLEPPVYQACWDQSIFLVAPPKHNFDRKSVTKVAMGAKGKIDSFNEPTLYLEPSFDTFLSHKMPSENCSSLWRQDKWRLLQRTNCDSICAYISSHASIQIKIFTLIM